MARKLRAPKTDKPKKSGKTKSAPLLLGSASDEIVKETYDRALKAKLAAEKAAKDAEPYKAEIKSAEGVFRAVLKDGKKKGVDPDDILWRLAQRSRSPEEIDKETKRRNRLAFLTNLPIGTQLGMFEDGKTTIATAIENANSPDGEQAAHQAGYDAGKAGKGITTNPYPLESAAFDAFEKGWGKQQSERALSMGGNGKSKSASAEATAH